MDVIIKCLVGAVIAFGISRGKRGTTCNGKRGREYGGAV